MNRRNQWLPIPLLVCGLLVFGIAHLPLTVMAQQTNPSQQKPPLEYIESSSPVAGGGVVTSVNIPGRSGPAYRLQQPTRESSLWRGSSPTARLASAQSEQGQSVLSPNRITGSGVSPQTQSVSPTGGQFYQSPPANSFAYQSVPPATAGANGGFVTSSGLGVPVDWNRTLRPNGAGWNGGFPSGTIAAPPNSLPSAASLPPTLANVGRPAAVFNRVPVVPQGQSTYTPVINLGRFPANTYAGQGILGSPKLYVNGQPLRNFLRYLIVP